MSERTDRLLRVLLPVVTVVAFFAVWTVYVDSAKVSAFILPPPLEIGYAFVRLVGDGGVWKHVLVTVEEAVAGFAIAVALGLVFGTLLAKLRLAEMALKPFIVALQLVPKIALVPLFILWFGFGIESKVVISAALAFFPIFANALIGFKSVDRGDRDLFISMQAKPLATFWLLDLPSALPVILTGAEVGIVLAIIGAIVGEFMGGNVGLGYLAVAKLQDLKVADLFAVILLLTLIGLTLYSLVAGLRRWLTPWHQAVDTII
ncbi:MAG: ABC transporter permease subunit [Rhodopseudomonas sp.]|nr:ABC transporter permease subunit [Rhodopseudomonas sp.]